MADLKTQLPLLTEATTVNDSDLFHIRQGAVDKKVTFDIIKNNISASDVDAIGVGIQLTTTLPLQGGGTLGDSLTLTVADATASQKGVIQNATAAETQTGVVNNKAVTPFSLASLTASETRAGLVERATDIESLSDDTTRYINSKQLNARVNTRTTEARVLELINQERQKLWPVGSIYTNANTSTNPASLLGFGTWQQFGQGRVLVGVNTGNSNFNTLGKTGGSQDAVVVSHGHGVSDPGHAHTTRLNREQVTRGNNAVYGDESTEGVSPVRSDSSKTGIQISPTGENGTNKNLQPYITVYMWRRTA